MNASVLLRRAAALLVLPALSLAPAFAIPPAEELAAQVTIHRDTYGVAHIDAPTDAGAAFGMGYAQAEDFFWQLEDSYAQSIGRYAELIGESGVDSDMLNHAFEVVPRSKADYENGAPDVKAIAEGFVAGINHCLAKRPDIKPRMIDRFEPWMVLCYERHILMSFLYGQVHYGKGNIKKVKFDPKGQSGSNAWAIAPSKTADGHAMLYCNPHQPYYGFGQWYEAHLRSGEGLNSSGAALFGGPLITIGHNEHLGWTHTVNEPDVADHWRETFDDPAEPLHYKYGGGYRKAEQFESVIKVSTKNGMEERRHVFRKTHHGPIVGQEDATRYISANVAKVFDGDRARQALGMNKAKNLEEFRAALGLLNLQMFNTIYADKSGNIYYLYNGAIPRRDPSFNWRSAVDGSDPRADWGPLHPLDELPQMLNPAGGYLQNCNSTPFLTADDGNPSIHDFPAYMAEDRLDDKRRAKMSRKLLREANRVTFEDWQVLALDTTLYWPMNEMPKLKREWELLKTSDPALHEKSKPYFEHLMNWDFKAGIESTQATLCVEWYAGLYEGMYPAENLKPIYVDKPGMKFDALIIAAEKLKSMYGDWRVKWGDIYRLQRQPDVADFIKIPFSDKEESVPSPGVNGPLGVAFTVYYTPPFLGRKKRYAVVGNSYMGVFEFGPRIKAVSLLQYGASGNPKSPHFFDQARMLSEKKFKPAYFYWEDVEANTKVKYHPGSERPDWWNEAPAAPAAAAP